MKEYHKDYFPRSKAPEHVKDKVLQHVYWNKKNLTKRFSFYKIYVPSFILFFVVMGWWAFFTAQNKALRGTNPLSFQNMQMEEIVDNETVNQRENPTQILMAKDSWNNTPSRDSSENPDSSILGSQEIEKSNEESNLFDSPDYSVLELGDSERSKQMDWVEWGGNNENEWLLLSNRKVILENSIVENIEIQTKDIEKLIDELFVITHQE
jgi:hypothetical protein